MSGTSFQLDCWKPVTLRVLTELLRMKVCDFERLGDRRSWICTRDILKGGQWRRHSMPTRSSETSRSQHDEDIEHQEAWKGLTSKWMHFKFFNISYPTPASSTRSSGKRHSSPRARSS